MQPTDALDTLYLNIIAYVKIPNKENFNKILILQSYSLFNLNIAELSDKNNGPYKLILISPKDMLKNEYASIHDTIFIFIHQLFNNLSGSNGETVGVNNYTSHPYTQALYDKMISYPGINKDKTRKLCNDIYLLHAAWVDIVTKYLKCETHDDLENFKKNDAVEFAHLYQNIYKIYVVDRTQSKILKLEPQNKVIDAFKTKLIIIFSNVKLYFLNYVKKEMHMLKNMDIGFIFGIRAIYGELIKEANYPDFYNNPFTTGDVNNIFNNSATEHVNNNADLYYSIFCLILN